MSSTVYVVQVPAFIPPGGREWVRRDVSDARRFGRLEELWRPGNVVETDLPKAVRTIGERLADFDNASDFLVLAGDPTLIAVAFALARDRTPEGEAVSVLKWDNRARVYYEVPVVV